MPRPSKAAQLSEPSQSECEDRVVHVEAVRAARAALPGGAATRELTNLFAALGDPTRLRIMAALATRELCVCDLAATIGQTESAVSHQLRLLRSLSLVRSRREGRRVFYALDDDHVLGIYDQACDHVHHNLTLAGPVASGPAS